MTSVRRPSQSLLLAAAIPCTATLTALGLAQPPAQTSAPGETPKPMVLTKSIEAVLADRIAKQLIAASPLAAPGDSKARDLASAKLGACDDLINATGAGNGGGGRILFGGFNPAQGYDPEAYRLNDLSHDDYFQLTELNPVVWAKLYLSTFMFPGQYTIHREGRFTVLELDAKFRSDMDPGEYPYPFWHSPNKWTAYVKVQSVMLIFEPGRLIACMRRSPDPLSVEQVRKPWDTNWKWTDAHGDPQPRVSLYSYLFSKDNPHVAPLEKSYRELETHFRAQNCTLCHEPDNRSRINDLLLLGFPNQALVMRRTLVAILEGNEMPPGSALAHEPQGVQDPKALADMTRLAKEFSREADAAFAYEQAHRPAPAPDPKSNRSN